MTVTAPTTVRRGIDMRHGKNCAAITEGGAYVCDCGPDAQRQRKYLDGTPVPSFRNLNVPRTTHAMDERKPAQGKK